MTLFVKFEIIQFQLKNISIFIKIIAISGLFSGKTYFWIWLTPTLANKQHVTT